MLVLIARRRVYTVLAKLAIKLIYARGRGMPSRRSARQATTQDTVALNPKKEAGNWLRKQRQNAGLSQIDLATRLGFRYYTFISQIENGYGRVPSHSMAAWARALGVRPARFARILLGYYDPALYRVLFKDGLP
jgi:DNA-binding XRE family transcriptional regulator